MTAAELLALRPGTDGDEWWPQFDTCGTCGRYKQQGHDVNCLDARLSAAQTAAAQAMERWEALKEWVGENFPAANTNFILAKMADLERGEK